MGQKTVKRRQASLTINAFSTKIVQPLGRGMIYREIALRLTGSWTQAAANNIASTLGRGDEWNLIERIDIVANGSDVIRSFTGYQLKMLNRAVYGVLPRIQPFLGDGVTANPAFDSTLIIPFWMPKALYPMDTALDSSKLSDLRLEITVAAPSGINSANAPTAVAATLDVFSYESYGIEVQNTDLRIFQIQSTLAGANAAFELDLPVNAVYRGFLVNFASAGLSTSADIPPFIGTTNGNLLTPSGITNIKLKSGPTTFRDVSVRAEHDWNRIRYGIVREITPNAAQTGVPNMTTPIFMHAGKSTALNEDAWLWFDLIGDGYMTEAIDAYGWTELKLEFNVAAAGQITVLPFQMFPPRKAAA